MPYVDEEKRRTYNREYAKARYDRRMAQIHAEMGGKCAICGSEENLEVHHKDPSSKEFDLTTKHSLPWKQVLKEVKKCELRCPEHHRDAHAPVHGTISMYRNRRCRCEPCKEAWNAKSRGWKAVWRAKNNGHVTPGATNVE